MYMASWHNISIICMYNTLTSPNLRSYWFLKLASLLYLKHEVSSSNKLKHKVQTVLRQKNLMKIRKKYCQIVIIWTIFISLTATTINRKTISKTFKQYWNKVFVQVYINNMKLIYCWSQIFVCTAVCNIKQRMWRDLLIVCLCNLTVK